MKNIRVVVPVLVVFLLLISGVIFLIKQCGAKPKYADAEIESILKKDSVQKIEYQDSLNFIHGQLDLQLQANAAHIDKIHTLEDQMNENAIKHTVTKKKIKQVATDTAGQYAILVPNEYVDECETCFAQQKEYIKQNKQLQFERDSYDTLMRMQDLLNESRINALEGEKQMFEKLYTNIKKPQQPTRKLKVSAAAQLNNLFIPNGGGPGLIYEDKKFNEFGGTVMFTQKGNMYIFHIAKTISLKRKK